ncbi:MAG: hypothetical protein ACYC2K_10345 [Gemmatimonadales bacterium]
MPSNDKSLLQEPLLWITFLLMVMAIAVAWGISAAAPRGGGTPLPSGVIKNSLLPIFLPVLAEMVAFFFALDENQTAAIRRRPSDSPQTRVALGCALAYGLAPTLIILLDVKANVPADLATFHIVAQPIFAYVIVYYYGRKLPIPAPLPQNAPDGAAG